MTSPDATSLTLNYKLSKEDFNQPNDYKLVKVQVHIHVLQPRRMILYMFLSLRSMVVLVGPQSNKGGGWQRNCEEIGAGATQ